MNLGADLINFSAKLTADGEVISPWPPERPPAPPKGPRGQVMIEHPLVRVAVPVALAHLANREIGVIFTRDWLPDEACGESAGLHVRRRGVDRACGTVPVVTLAHDDHCALIRACDTSSPGGFSQIVSFGPKGAA